MLSTESVSYTHLDVYKRQPVRAAPVAMSAYIRQKENCKPVLGCTNSPVSYTHLDVYKRQILSSLIPNWLKMSLNDASPGIAHDAIT